MQVHSSRWEAIFHQYQESQSNLVLSPQDLQKLDDLILSDDIEHINNGLTLLCTLAPEYLCRYLMLQNDQISLQAEHTWPNIRGAERALISAIQHESLWLEVYQSTAFDAMRFRGLGDVALSDLSQVDKTFCTRMGKTLVRIPPGEFVMGLPEYWESGEPEVVQVTSGFMMGQYAVTQVLWDSVMGFNPSHFKGANRPVDTVSLLDCIVFCNRLSEQEGLQPVYQGLDDYQAGADIDAAAGEQLAMGVTWNPSANGYRLPTEVEWEYAARANTSYPYAGSNDLDEVAWYAPNCDHRTHPVGQWKPNGWGLYDMSGNVTDWCWGFVEYDWDAEEIEVGSMYPDFHHVMQEGYIVTCRGGCLFYGGGERLSVTFRDIEEDCNLVTSRNIGSGFRVVRSV